MNASTKKYCPKIISKKMSTGCNPSKKEMKAVDEFGFNKQSFN